MKKKLYFGSNLKMYKTIDQTVAYLHRLADQTNDISRQDIELFILPSYTSLDAAAKTIDRTKIKLGAQNMCWEDEGQFTGEVSPLMLKELDLDLVMIGHSERRHGFGEDDYQESKKVTAALKHGFTTLLCIGETAQQKEFDISAEILKTQLKTGFHSISKKDLSNIWVAYEPVWSIGVNGTPASAEYAEQMHQIIKSALVEIFGPESAQIPVLYGGSVNPENACKLIVKPSIDGLFVGRSAWHADQFNTLIRDTLAAYKNQ